VKIRSNDKVKIGEGAVAKPKITTLSNKGSFPYVKAFEEV